jgi:hypothetical protein
LSTCFVIVVLTRAERTELGGGGLTPLRGRERDCHRARESGQFRLLAGWRRLGESNRARAAILLDRPAAPPGGHGADLQDTVSQRADALNTLRAPLLSVKTLNNTQLSGRQAISLFHLLLSFFLIRSYSFSTTTSSRGTRASVTRALRVTRLPD